MEKIILGTRGSQLALVQAELVKELIENNLPYSLDIQVIKSIGDKDQVSQLHSFRGQGVFTGTIEQALLEHEIDIAMHSLKDLPIDNTPGLYLPIYMKRHKPNDTLLVKAEFIKSEAPLTLKEGIRFATGSPRRQSQFLQSFPNAIPIDIRGNVNTRIERLKSTFIDALIMAEAIFDRLTLELPSGVRMIRLPIDKFPTAPGQGVIAVQARLGEFEDLKEVNHKNSMRAVQLERSILSKLGGGCDISLGLNIGPVGGDWEVSASYPRTNWNPATDPQLSRLNIRINTLEDLQTTILDFLSMDLFSHEIPYQNRGNSEKSVILLRDKEDNATYFTEINNQFQAIAISIPVLDYIIDYGQVDSQELIKTWENTQWIVFTSKRAVEFYYYLSKRHRRGPVRVAAVGPATAKSLRSYGFPVHIVASGSITNLKHLLSEAREIYPGKVLFLHGQKVTDFPSFDSFNFEVYRTKPRELILPFRPHELVVFSKYSAQIAIDKLGVDCCDRWIAIGKATGDYLSSIGANVVVANTPTPLGVVDAMKK